MEGDDDDSAARSNNRHCSVQKSLKTAKLIIHIHAQRLERPRCRMNLSISWGTQHFFDCAHQLCCRFERTESDDGASDCPRSTLFPELEQNVRNFCLTIRVDDFKGVQLLIAIHSHIQSAL